MIRTSPIRLWAALLLAAPLAAQAQTGGVGIGTTIPAASAALDVTSTTKGFLAPRLTTAQRDAIVSPAAGLTIYNTTTNKLNTWNGTSWDAALSATEQSFAGTAVTFNYTGAPQTYTVPAGVTALTVDAAGAGGANGQNGGTGGTGARVQATLVVTPGEVLTLYVGGAGGSSGAAGYNGGGTGSYDRGQGGGGGGASDVRRSVTAPSTALAERLLVAGGGGGGGFFGNGGGGGAPNGLNGVVNGGPAGQGATQTAGGNVGGALGQGGPSSSAAGGGGGGYYGGGGGSFDSGGGGGSSWVTPTGSSGLVLTASYRAGNGVIVLSPLAYAAPVLDASNFVNVPGDNLGDHTATRNLNLGAYALTGNGRDIGTTVGVGVRADGGLNLGQNTTGNNVLLGYGAGANTTGIQNTFLGYAAGSNTTTGIYNIFVGYATGNANLDGTRNTFVGTGSGNANSSGSFNLFGGFQSGLLNTTGSNNTFDGAGSGLNTTTGSFNTFSGGRSGFNNTTGSNNTVLGYNSGPASGALSNATAIGANVALTTDNTLVLGNGANVGIGTNAPASRLTVQPASNAEVGLRVTNGVADGTAVSGNIVLQTLTAGDSGFSFLGFNGSNASGETRYSTSKNRWRVGVDQRSTGDEFFIDTYSTAGTSVLRASTAGNVGLGTAPNASYKLNVNGDINAIGQVRANGVAITSDRRFKENIRPLGSALSSVLALRGVRYEWNALGVRRGGTAGAGQVGLIAQEIEKIYPELVSTDADGYKAVNYAQLTPVLIEAIKEQQAQIETLKAQVAAQAGDHAALQAAKAQSTATTEAFEARLRRLEAGQAQAQR